MIIRVCSKCKYNRCKVDEQPCYNCLRANTDNKSYFTPIETQSEELTEMTTDEQYADSVYAIVSFECSDLDSIYEDYIIKLVGEWGLQALRENGLLEGCGYLNGRKLYVLCDK